MIEIEVPLPPRGGAQIGHVDTPAGPVQVTVIHQRGSESPCLGVTGTAEAVAAYRGR